MKYLFFIALISSSTFAVTSDYTCETRWGVRAELTLDGKSTHVWLYEAHRRELIFQDYTKWEEKKGDEINYHFYPGSAPHTILTFKASDVASRPEKMRGWIDSRSAIGPSIWDVLACLRNN
jgi:hypothetical protein